jgi:hypothetical protein
LPSHYSAEFQRAGRTAPQNIGPAACRTMFTRQRRRAAAPS